MTTATQCSKCAIELNSETQSEGIRRTRRALCNNCERLRKKQYAPKYRDARNYAMRKKRSEAAKLRAPKPTVLERFLAKVEIRDGSECWWWTGALSSWGRYGVFNASLNDQRRTMLAHRFAMVSLNNVDPSGLFVCHTCDNHLCVNPEHLFLGTLQDNVDDMVRKKRNSRHQAAVIRALRAKRVALRKLTEQQAIDIFHRYNSGESAASLAEEHGVGKSAITCIANGKTWSHVTGLRCPRHYWLDADAALINR